MIVNNKEKEVLILTSTVLDGLYIVTTSLKCKIDNNKIMRKLFISLMLTLTAFIANAQPSAIAPRDYQQMLKKELGWQVLSLRHSSLLELEP